MDVKKRKVAVAIMFDADNDVKEITLGEFIKLLQKEHDMDEIITLSEIEILH